MSLTFSSAARSDVGLVRENNEDTGCAGPTLLAVADGMGGHAAGEVASSVVMYALREHSEDHTPEAITQAVERAQGALQAMSLVDPDLDGMGTTLVALAVGPQGVSLAHIGDSRIYRLRDGCLDQITTDHTHVQRLVEAGRLTSAQARHHPYRSVILRSIDDTHADLPDVNLTEQLADGDRVLLCSDGLSDYLTDAQLAGILSHGSPPCARRRWSPPPCRRARGTTSPWWWPMPATPTHPRSRQHPELRAPRAATWSPWARGCSTRP